MKKDRILLIGGESEKEHRSKDSFLLAGNNYSHNNFGNNVHYDYPKNYLDYDKENSLVIPRISYLTKDQLKNPSLYFDKIIIQVANILNENLISVRLNIVPILQFLKNANLPIIMMGLGAQANLNGVIDLEALTPLKEVFATLQDLETKILVRGDFSYSVLDRMGFNKNVYITGCPSFFKHGARFQVPMKKDIKILNKIAYQTDNPSPELQEYITLNYFDKANYETSIIFQTEYIFLHSDHDYIWYHRYNNIVENYKLNISKEEFLTKLKEYKVFPNVQDWEDFIRTQDFLLGQRIHGNIVSILAGTPSCLIAHDMRTKELGDFLKIPSISPIDVQKYSIKEIYENIDYTEMKDVYPMLYNNFKGVLKECNIASYFDKWEAEIRTTNDERYLANLLQNIDNKKEFTAYINILSQEKTISKQVDKNLATPQVKWQGDQIKEQNNKLRDRFEEQYYSEFTNASRLGTKGQFIFAVKLLIKLPFRLIAKILKNKMN